MSDNTPFKILLVDDEVDILEPLAFNLEASGFSVVTATSGNKAFAIFQKEPFDAIITDIKMADGNGIELLKNIKNLSPLCPVVSFVTGYSDLTQREAYHLGANSTFPKPFDFTKLKSKIDWSVQPEEKRWGNPFSQEPDIVIVNEEIRPLGNGGVSLKVSADRFSDFTPNSAVDFEFLCEEGRVKGQGRLRWLDGNAGLVGVEFCYLQPSSCEMVKKIIWSKKPKSYIPHS